MFELRSSCRACDKAKPHDPKEQWWYCKGYYKISGLFCADCYEKISHDSYGRPNHPGEYLMMLLKLGMK